MDLEEFYGFFTGSFSDYSVQPFNLVNTIVYGAILLLFCFFVLFPLLDKKAKIKFNYRFVLALMPYILFGVCLKAIAVENIFPGLEKVWDPTKPGFWAYTPGIWIAVFLVTVIGVVIAKAFEKKFEFNKVLAGIGLIFSLPLLTIVLGNFTSWGFFLLTVATIVAIILIVIFFVNRVSKSGLLRNNLNKLALSGQVIDGVAAFYAIGFLGFREQHPVSSLILYNVPFLFIFVKIALILVILHYVDKEIQGKNLKGFIKILLIILGFATGGASVLKIGLI